MAAQIGRGTLNAAKSSMVVVLRLASAREPDRVSAVLREGAGAIRAAYGAESDLWVSEPLPVEGGFAIVLARGWGSPSRLLGTEPALIQEIADRMRLGDGVIDAPRPIKSGWKAAIARGERLWPSARGYLYGVLQEPFGTAPREVPRDLIDVSMRWLRERATPGKPVIVLVDGSPIPTDWAGVHELACSLITGVLVLKIVADDPTSRRFSHHPPPTVVLSGSVYPKAAWIEAADNDADISSAMVAMRDAARQADDLDWAAVTRWSGVKPYSGFATSFDEDDVSLPASSGGYIASKIRDVAVPDAYWWQLIGAGHIERLGEVPPEASRGAEKRHFEVTFGTPDDWLPGSSSAAEIQAHARQVLAPLLLDESEAERASTERFLRARESDTTGFFKQTRPAG